MKTGFIDSENKSRFYVGEGFIETINNGHNIYPVFCGGYAKIRLNITELKKICSNKDKNNPLTKLKPTGKNIVLFVSRNHEYPQSDLSVYFETDSYFVNDNFLNSDYRLSLDINKFNEISNISDSNVLKLFILPKPLFEIQNDLAFDVVAVCDNYLKNIPSRQKVYDGEINEEEFKKLYILNSVSVGGGSSSNYLNYHFDIKDITADNVQKLLDNNCRCTVEALASIYQNRFVQVIRNVNINRRRNPVLTRALDLCGIQYNTTKNEPKFNKTIQRTEIHKNRKSLKP